MAEKPRRPLVQTWADIPDNKTRFLIPRLLPAPAAIMVAGEERSGKTLILQDIGNNLAYGRTWFDGTTLTPSLVFYVTNERPEDLKPRQRAWLRANGLPDNQLLQDNFCLIDVTHPAFHTQPVPGTGRKARTETSDRLNLLDIGSVRTFIEGGKEYAAAVGLPVGMVVLDTITSLLLEKLDDPPARILTRHMHLIAEEFVCCTIGVQHTSRSDNDRHIGPYSLSANLDGTLIAKRDWTHSTNGALLGLRSTLFVKSLKMIADRHSFEFIGSVVPLGMDADGKSVDAVAMRCTGYVAADPKGDSIAVRRLWIAEHLAPGHEQNFAGVCRLCGWDRGANQYGWIREAIPQDWSTVVLNDGTARELRRVPHGKFERIECRSAESSTPQTTEDKPKPQQKHESEAKAAQTGKRGGAQPGAGKPLGTIRIGSMAREAFAAALDAPLSDDDRVAAFVAAIETLRAAGAEVTREGEQVLAFVRQLGETGRGLKMSVRLFTKSNTPRAVLRSASAKLKATKKAKGKNHPDAGHGEGGE